MAETAARSDVCLTKENHGVNCVAGELSLSEVEAEKLNEVIRAAGYRFYPIATAALAEEPHPQQPSPSTRKVPSTGVPRQDSLAWNREKRPSAGTKRVSPSKLRGDAVSSKRSKNEQSQVILTRFSSRRAATGLSSPSCASSQLDNVGTPRRRGSSSSSGSTSNAQIHPPGMTGGGGLFKDMNSDVESSSCSSSAVGVSARLTATAAAAAGSSCGGRAAFGGGGGSSVGRAQQQHTDSNGGGGGGGVLLQGGGGSSSVLPPRPPRLPPPEVTSGVWQDACRAAMLELECHPSATWFLAPLNPDLEPGMSDYWEKVKCPMDFQTIRQKMDERMYTHPFRWQQDIRQIFFNAFVYHRPQSPVWNSAIQLATFFEDLSKRLAGINPYAKYISPEARAVAAQQTEQISTATTTPPILSSPPPLTATTTAVQQEPTIYSQPGGGLSLPSTAATAATVNTTDHVVDVSTTVARRDVFKSPVPPTSLPTATKGSSSTSTGGATQTVLLDAASLQELLEKAAKGQTQDLTSQLTAVLKQQNAWSNGGASAAVTGVKKSSVLASAAAAAAAATVASPPALPKGMRLQTDQTSVAYSSAFDRPASPITSCMPTPPAPQPALPGMWEKLNLSSPQKKMWLAKFRDLDVAYRKALLEIVKEELDIHPVFCAKDSRYVPDVDLLSPLKQKQFFIYLRTLVLAQKAAIQERQLPISIARILFFSHTTSTTAPTDEISPATAAKQEPSAIPVKSPAQLPPPIAAATRRSPLPSPSAPDDNTDSDSSDSSSDSSTDNPSAETHKPGGGGGGGSRSWESSLVVAANAQASYFNDANFSPSHRVYKSQKSPPAGMAQRMEAFFSKSPLPPQPLDNNGLPPFLAKSNPPLIPPRTRQTALLTPGTMESAYKPNNAGGGMPRPASIPYPATLTGPTYMGAGKGDLFHSRFQRRPGDEQSSQQRSQVTDATPKKSCWSHWKVKVLQESFMSMNTTQGCGSPTDREARAEQAEAEI